MTSLNGVLLSPIKIINTSGGDVLHAMKKTDLGFYDFGEAYFSEIQSGAIKAWKRHKEMIMNLIVPVGVIRFVLYDDRKNSSTFGHFQEVILSRDNYRRLTVPANLWMGFQCIGKQTGVLLNIASIPHVQEEADRVPLNAIKYNWEI